MRVLVADDDPDLAAMVRRGLGEEGYRVDVVDTGDDAVWHAGEYDYDVIVLDVMLPGRDGFQVCEDLRAAQVWVPVLVLSARADITDRVEGLNRGADDYLVKPFGFSELVARVQALARRGARPRPVVLRAGDLWLDPSTRTAGRGEAVIELSSTEFSVLEVFARHVDTVLTRTLVTEHVGDWAIGSTSNVVDQYVSYLRRKIDRPFDVEQLLTVRGAGYRLLEHARPRTDG